MNIHFLGAVVLPFLLLLVLFSLLVRVIPQPNTTDSPSKKPYNWWPFCRTFLAKVEKSRAPFMPSVSRSRPTHSRFRYAAVYPVVSERFTTGLLTPCLPVVNFAGLTRCCVGSVAG